MNEGERHKKIIGIWYVNMSQDGDSQINLS